MTEHDERAQARAAASTTAARVIVPLLAALAASALVGVGVSRFAADFIPSVSAWELPVALGTAVLAGTVLVGRLVAGVARSRAELAERYEAALADALEDPLTGLGNHRGFQEELERQVEHHLRHEQPLSLVLLDLDEFKQINDSQGHAAGDRVLRAFGARMRTGVRRGDRPYRIGGDEFAILLPQTDADGAFVVARRLLAESLQPPLRAEHAHPISFSAGVSSIPTPAEGRAQLYAQADAALYAAKRGGRTDVVTFDPTMAEVEMAGGSASSEVAEVIAKGLIAPVYQPICELETGEIVGVEGLIRPQPPSTFADPATLFAAAEASGRVAALDLACIEAIVAGAGDLADGRFLSVNLSPQTLESPEFSAHALLGILGRYGFPPDRLIIELTEHQPIRDAERARAKLEPLRASGVRLAADDLGAGNAGLRLLAEFHFDVLKIDLSLVHRSAPGGPSSAVLSSVVELAYRTAAIVIAEGIEHAVEVAQLAGLGVRVGQGYFLGRPAPMADVAPALLAGGPPPDPGSMTAWRESIGLPTAV